MSTLSELESAIQLTAAALEKSQKDLVDCTAEVERLTNDLLHFKRAFKKKLDNLSSTYPHDV
jgi:hypothetical protein